MNSFLPMQDVQFNRHFCQLLCIITASPRYQLWLVKIDRKSKITYVEEIYKMMHIEIPQWISSLPKFLYP